MSTFFIPYVHDVPATVLIKGHRLLIVASDSEDMIRDLEIIGGEEIREIQLQEGEPEESEILADLAAGINGGVVLTPPGVSPAIMIHNLEAELPWIH